MGTREIEGVTNVCMSSPFVASRKGTGSLVLYMNRNNRNNLVLCYLRRYCGDLKDFWQFFDESQLACGKLVKEDLNKRSLDSRDIN